ncbi:MAG TPA: AsmA-like C-terminal domain-containing protein [Burkholderiales bacterium]|nr:AsmA-like C-terminal domain-containing protein [Burkholderiales bacterium]
MLGALLVLAALFLPDILDTPRVRAEIQHILSEAVRGEVTWEELRIRILPVPHGSLREARLEIPQVASVRAEEATARLRLLPLFRGRAEIISVTVTRPVIRISVVPAPAVAAKAPEKEPVSDIVGLYRSAMGPVVDAVREFAPDTLVTIEDAELEVRVPGALPMQLSKLWLRARAGAQGMGLDATAASPYWSWLALSGRVEYADLAARVSLGGANIEPQAWLERYVGKVPVGVSMAPVNLRVEARTDARTSLECELDARTDSVGITREGESVDIPNVGVKGSARVGAQEIIVGVDDIRVGSSRLGSGEFRLSAKDGAISGHSDYDLDLAQGMDYTRHLVPAPVREVLASLQPVTGRAQGRVKLALGPPGWSVGVDVRKSDVAVQVRDLPGPVRLGGGAVEIDRHKLKLARVALSLPAGTVSLSTLQHLFKDGSTAGTASFDLDVVQILELARRALPQENREALADIQTAAGRVEGNTRFAFGRGDWKLGVNVLKSDASFDIRQMPGPITIAGLSLDANPASVTISRAQVSLLDASAIASMAFDDFEAGPRMRVTIAEGTVGENYLAWVWNTANLPARYEPATPIRIAHSRIAWHPKQGLEVQANAQFDAGPSVAVDLGWAAGALDIRRMTIQDGRSDAELALRVKGTALEGRYAGSLSSTSVAAVLKRAKMPSGTVAGDLRFTLDREHPERMTADGQLTGEALDLAALVGKPLKIERIDLATDNTALHVREATVGWAGQQVTLRGDLTRSESGPVIDAQLESPGINLDALLPSGAEIAADAQRTPAAGGGDPAARIWPLPVTGRIAVRSDFIRRGRHKVAPVAATLLLEERRAHLDLEEAQLCGISVPLILEATPQGYSASARIAAQKQELEQTAHCLSGAGVLITGQYDLKADISTRGKLAELPKNLKGTVRADARDGKVMKFALLGNILSMASVDSLMNPDGPKLDAQGFPYRALAVVGHFEDGRFIVEEGSFQSDALGLATNGWISITDYSSRLVVLVAPFGRVDQLMRKVPVLGYVLGGTFTSVPVGVSGDIRNPLVVPLGPVAVTSEVLGIFERTLKLPAKLITPTEAK